MRPSDPSYTLNLSHFKISTVETHTSFQKFDVLSIENNLSFSLFN